MFVEDRSYYICVLVLCKALLAGCRMNSVRLLSASGSRTSVCLHNGQIVRLIVHSDAFHELVIAISKAVCILSCLPLIVSDCMLQQARMAQSSSNA